MPESPSKISHSSSPLKMINEYTSAEKQGIVTILRSDFEIPKAAVSLRRTLSADMSSEKWLTQHGFSAMKKIASSEGLCVSIADSSSSPSYSSEGEEDYNDRKEERGRRKFDFWSSIQDEMKKIETEKQGQFDTWSSILSQKSADVAKLLPVPYVHPLVKKSTSSLSEESLEICTESLGSETGSDGFSSYPPSEVEDMDEEMKEEQQPETFSQKFDWHEGRPIKFNHKKSPPRSFPPPLPSLSCRDGASVRMQSRRENGRLILEAVSEPSQKTFLADRRDGCLVLSFITTPSNQDEQNEQSTEEELNKEEEELEELLVHDFEEVKETEMGEEKDDEEIESDMEFKELEIVVEKAPKLSSSVMNFHRLALMMKKPNGRNSPWPNDLSDMVQFQIQKEQDGSKAPTPLAQSLPPRPKAAGMIPSPPTRTAATAAASLNAYECYWRSKPTIKSATTQNPNPISQQLPQPIKNSTRKLIFPNNSMGNENQQVLVLRGNRGDYLVPLSSGCKVPRRSLLLWEPYCIATT